MPKQTQRNRFTFSYPLSDTIIKSWLDNQNGNTSLALRIVLHSWINQHGNKNVVDDIVNHDLNHRQDNDNVNPNLQVKNGTQDETVMLTKKQSDPEPDQNANKQAPDDTKVSADDLNHYLMQK